MQQEDILEPTNGECHLCTLHSTCRPLCNISMHLITILNMLMPRYQQAHLNAKCHEMAIMMKFLIINVTQRMPQNRLNDAITRCWVESSLLWENTGLLAATRFACRTVESSCLQKSRSLVSSKLQTLYAQNPPWTLQRTHTKQDNITKNCVGLNCKRYFIFEQHKLSSFCDFLMDIDPSPPFNMVFSATC